MKYVRYMRSWSPGYLEWRAEVEERRKQVRIMEIEAAHDEMLRRWVLRTGKVEG